MSIGGQYPGYSYEEIDSARLQPLKDRIKTKQLALCEKRPQDYDEADIEYLHETDRLIDRVLVVKKDEDAAVPYLDNTLKWRKKYVIKQLKNN